MVIQYVDTGTGLGGGSRHFGPVGGGPLTPDRRYRVDGIVDGNSLSCHIDGKPVVKGIVPEGYLHTGQMACLRLAPVRGRFDNVKLVGKLDPEWLKAALE